MKSDYPHKRKIGQRKGTAIAPTLVPLKHINFDLFILFFKKHINFDLFILFFKKTYQF